MARLTRVEQDSADFKKMLGRIANILTDQNDRIDNLGERVDRLGERVDRLGDRLDQLGEQLGSRLDRLIAVTFTSAHTPSSDLPTSSGASHGSKSTRASDPHRRRR